MAKNRYTDWRLETPSPYEGLKAEEEEYLRAFNRFFTLGSTDPKDIAVIRKYKPDFTLSAIDPLSEKEFPITYQQAIDAAKYRQRNDCMNVNGCKVKKHYAKKTKSKEAAENYNHYLDLAKLVEKFS